MKCIKYSKETIKKAQFLYERGHHLPYIASSLGIKRQMTVFDWSKKFQWKRLHNKPVAPSSKNNSSEVTPIISASSSLVPTKLTDTFLHTINFTDSIILFLESKLLSAELTVSDITRIMEKLPLLLKFLQTSEICNLKSDETTTSQDTPEPKKDNILKFLGINSVQ